MSLTHANKTSFKKGQVPHNKGVRNQDVLDKITALKEGKPVECKKHGIHIKWRLDKHGEHLYPKCLMCNGEASANWFSNNKEKHYEARAKRVQDNPYKYLIANAVHNSNKRTDRKVDLTEDQVKLLAGQQNYKCALSGIVFDDSNMPSLDRIDSSKDYTIDNVQLVTRQVNYAKQSLSNEEFINLCERVAVLNMAGKGKKKKKA